MTKMHLGLLVALWLALGPVAASAQTVSTAADVGQAAAAVSSAEPDPEGVFMPKGLVAPKPSLESEDIATQAVAAPTFAAPLVYVCDSTGRLATINLNTKVVKVIGKLGLVLTDIGFSPSGVLYGISFSQLYRVNPLTAKVTKVGTGLAVGGMNALTFNKSGQAVAASNTTTGFFVINTTTGRAQFAGADGGFKSAGDFAYDGVHLYLAATGKKLVDFNFSTNKYLSHPVTLVNLFGLVVPQKGALVGFAGTKAYRLNQVTGASTLYFDFTGKGLSQINGAASKSLF